MIDDVDRLLELALARGAAAAEVYAEQSVTRRVKVFRGAVEELTSARRKGVGLRVFQEGSVGYAYTSDLSDDSYAETVATALGNARVADHDPDSVLPVPREQPAEVDVYDPGLERATDDERIDLALAVERAALAADARVKSVDESVYADGDAQVYLANSAGVRGQYREGHCYAFAYVLGEQDGQIETGLSFTVARKPADLDPQGCGTEAAQRAVALLGASKAKTTKTTVVLDPFVSASFFGVLSAALTAEAVQKGRSLFAGRLGEQIAGPGVTLTDDGIHPDGLASAPFDGEGVPCRRTTLIADGVLRGFLYNVRSGHRDGRESTGNGVRGSYQTTPGVGPTNLVLSGPEVPLDELIGSIDHGVLVTNAIGIHSGANPVSGEFSVGINGLLIEAGRVTTAVREVTMAGDIVSMLRSIVALGDDARWVPSGSILTPSVAIEGVSIGGA
ncbi:MAG TPA: TldD/PmbA family protein [Thermoleophilia bacterium]|nr:TldD/PmbA family protein [Thermoleophilia bacterium]